MACSCYLFSKWQYAERVLIGYYCWCKNKWNMLYFVVLKQEHVLFMTVVVWQFFCSLLGYDCVMLQPYFNRKCWRSAVFLLIAIISSSTRHCTTLSVVRVNSCCWCDHTSQVEIVVYRPTHCAVIPLVYSRSQGLPGRWCLHLEWFAGGCDLRSITAGVQTTPEDSSVQPQLSKHVLSELCLPSLTVVLAVFFILRPL